MADAKSRGMKVLVIVAYAPSWLTWSGTKMGVPRDWAAWDDIVKKTYQLFQTNIDFVEVWNEPSSGKYVDDAFLDLRKSPYAPKNAEMVIHA